MEFAKDQIKAESTVSGPCGVRGILNTIFKSNKIASDV
jgi:hypothetical protein